MALTVIKTGTPPREYADDVIDDVVDALNELETRVDVIDADPIEVVGARDDGTALASLLTALDTLGLITDSTTAS